MYHISSSWILHDIPTNLQDESEKISLRGYDKNFIALSGEFSWKKPLSVDDIASDICPVRKDLHNAKARSGLSKKEKDGRQTWGRIAGLIVEPYCSGLLNKFDDLYNKSRKMTYQTLQEEVYSYSENFFKDDLITKQMSELEKIASLESLSPPPSLRLTLEYSARNELAFLGVDWLLKNEGDLLLHQRSPIIADKKQLIIQPNSEVTGISQPSTPDFFLNNMNIIGDIKSGREFKRSHQWTCAGYALAHESEVGNSKGDTNFGIVYFLEIHNSAPTPARSYSFAITDTLRQEFIDRRNKAYAILSKKDAPNINIVERESHCVRCKFLDLCDDDRKH